MSKVSDYIKARYMRAIRRGWAGFCVGEVWLLKDGRRVRIELLNKSLPGSGHHHRLLNFENGRCSSMMDHILREKVIELIETPSTD